MAAEYAKGRDNISSTKLNYFHYALHQLLGYNLHPLIQRPSEGTSRIADFGTQTAIWPVQVAEEDSTRPIEVHGFDISDRFFPPASWLPSNVSLHLYDIYQGFSSQPSLAGRFDVVHIRLFLMLSDDQVRKMIDSAITLLKPGGYIQWIEHDKLGLSVLSAKPELPTPATEAFLQMQQHPFPGYKPQWAHSIAGAMASAGLEVVADERLSMRPSLLTQLNDLHFLALLDVPPGISAPLDAFKEKHMQAMIEEFRQGTALVDAFVCVVGKKKAGPQK